MPNGDIVSGSSDGVVRVFSSHEERWATEADIKVGLLRSISGQWAIEEAERKKLKRSMRTRFLARLSLRMLSFQLYRCSMLMRNRQQVGDVKKSDLPGPEALSQPGKKEGQVIMVRNASGSVEAHQASTANTIIQSTK